MRFIKIGLIIKTFSKMYTVREPSNRGCTTKESSISERNKWGCDIMYIFYSNASIFVDFQCNRYFMLSFLMNFCANEMIFIVCKHTFT